MVVVLDEFLCFSSSGVFFFGSSSVASESSSPSSYPFVFDAVQPGLALLFEVYYHHLNPWTREDDDAIK